MDDFNERITKIINNYNDNIETDIKDRWNSWKKDLTTPEIYEVIGGLMSRQITIANHFNSSSNIWNGHIAPIILRTLVDNYINFAWILENPLERSRKFIYFGLGQEKLQLAHRKKELESREAYENEELMNKALEAWINDQRYEFLTEVSLKSWSEISVRKMAEEANCLDLYNYVYQPFSSNAHNMWNHIAKYNLVESKNPLHKHFRKPGILIDNPDLFYVELSCKYVAKMFNLFDIKIGFESTRKNSFHLYLEEIDNLNTDINNMNE